MEKNKHSLIIAFVNTGFTDLVMDAAVKAGASGGTVVHGRGTGSKYYEKMYGITISESKEMVMIVVKKDICDKVLKAINDAAGLQSPGHGIAFSLPVEAVAGISKPVKVEKTEIKEETK
ncbi:MAG: P-II family nitrogen regulator [Gammaproteobacteria bacterium]|nr:P-II family nitrogen regulator [Gammaproteobacteria bacterium]